MSVTLRDVAREAGVSIRTVSRVVNNKAEIADGTRQHVLAIINRLNYRPNNLARSLVSGKTHSIAVVIPQITDPFYPEFVQGVESVARQAGYHVFLCNTDEDPKQELDILDALAGKQVEGVILCGTRMSATQLLQANQRYKLVLVTSRAPSQVTTVNVAEENGAAMLTTHLVRLGHRHIGHIARLQNGVNARLDGYRQALRDHNLAASETNIEPVMRADIAGGRAATHRLLARVPKLTALVCYNDLVAVGAMQACAELGRTVPTDMAVVGFDDILLASLIEPALTTMHVARHHLGQMAVVQLLEQLQAEEAPGRPADTIKLTHTRTLPTQLIIRKSCGASTT